MMDKLVYILYNILLAYNIQFFLLFCIKLQVIYASSFDRKSPLESPKAGFNRKSPLELSKAHLNLSRLELRNDGRINEVYTSGPPYSIILCFILIMNR